MASYPAALAAPQGSADREAALKKQADTSAAGKTPFRLLARLVSTKQPQAEQALPTEHQCLLCCGCALHCTRNTCHLVGRLLLVLVTDQAVSAVL